MVSMSPERNSSIADISEANTVSIYASNDEIDFNEACAPSAGLEPTATSDNANALR